VTQPAAPRPGDLPVDVPALLATLAEYHGRQLADANLEAAKWRTAATGARTELAALRARVGELEAQMDDDGGDA
jgi:hypothetical protein